MGSLADLHLPTDEVEVPGTGASITVRGLSVADLGILLQAWGSQLNTLYAKAMTGGQDLKIEAVGQMLVTEFPEVVAEIIAIANDNPSLAAQAAKLAVPVQLDCLRKIAGLTFHSEAHAGNLLARLIVDMGILTRVMQATTTAGGALEEA